MLNSVQISQMCKVAPSIVFAMTGIKLMKCTYKQDAYDYNGDNVTESRHINNFTICRDGNTYRIGDLQAETIISRAINGHMYKNIIRELADKSDSNVENLDMTIPLEKYNSYNKYD